MAWASGRLVLGLGFRVARGLAAGIVVGSTGLVKGS